VRNARVSRRLRFKLVIEYDGGAFQGWQRLNDGPSVQGALEEAVFKVTSERVEVFGAGRTDSGVHAMGQVAHVDIQKPPVSAQRLMDALNAHLRPQTVAVLSAVEAPDNFHARFDAVGRVYLYRIVERRAPLTLERGRMWRAPRKLDLPNMSDAAQHLIGQHDFTTFRDAACQAKSPVKTLDRAELFDVGPEIHIWFEARSFLHRQVRSMVGTLVEVGLGKMSSDEFKARLDAKDRARCGPVAPSDGLYLVRVDYPEGPSLAEQGASTRGES
jgi:tRNA pseudouridine38-40 synthase